MSRKSYRAFITQLSDSMDLLLQKEKCMPSLILIYSGIDTMAWLNRDKTHENLDNNSIDFKNWVNSYLLPDAGLNCNAVDLYAARCSILHSYSAQSSLSRKGQARKIYYVWGSADVLELQKYIDMSYESGKTIAVSIDTLNRAFKISVQRFNAALNKNKSLSKLVSARSDKFLVYTPSEIIDNQF
jgi:hypothetical protein